MIIQVEGFDEIYIPLTPFPTTQSQHTKGELPLQEYGAKYHLLGFGRFCIFN